MRSEQTEPDEAYADEALTIPAEQVCFLIVKAREFDVKEGDSELESGSNASDDQMVSVLEEGPGDSVQQELTSFIENMTEDEQIDLVALAWLGRDDNTLADWPSIREEAAGVTSFPARRHGTLSPRYAAIVRLSRRGARHVRKILRAI